MSKKRILPHVQQPKKSSWCGAACMEMLFRHYGLKETMYTIKNHIIGGIEQNCRSNLMVSYCHNKNIPAMGAIIKDMQAVESLLICEYDIMVLCYPNNASHWVLASYTNNGFIYYNDPLENSNKGVNRMMQFSDMENLAKFHNEIPGFIETIIVRNPNSKARIGTIHCGICNQSVPFFIDSMPYIERILCPTCGEYYPISPQGHN